MPKKKNYTKNECIDLFSKCKNRSEFRKKYSEESKKNIIKFLK